MMGMMGRDDVFDDCDADLVDGGFHLEVRLEGTEVTEPVRLVVKLFSLHILNKS